MAGYREGWIAAKEYKRKWDEWRKSVADPAKTGSLVVGKRADVVVWSGDPFSVYTKAEKVYLDGALLFDRESGLRPVSDFMLGQRRGGVR